jgi:hypothetical protein
LGGNYKEINPMIRNLKILIAAAMALAAFGALSATAHAAEEFHCTVEPCTATLSPDLKEGDVLPNTTAHHLFIVTGVSGSAAFTCDQLSGQATSAKKTATELTFTNLKYSNAAGKTLCKIGAAETVEVNFTSCDYNFKALNGKTSTAQVHVLCTTAGDAIDISIKGTLCLQITPFTSTGIGYHDAELPSGQKKNIVTATANVAVPLAALDLKNTANANCNPLTTIGTLTGADYTTGNTLVTGETDPGGVMAEAWFE